jgi:hypothetical protein
MRVARRRSASCNRGATAAHATWPRRLQTGLKEIEMRWTWKHSLAVGLSAQISFTTALVAAVALSPQPAAAGAHSQGCAPQMPLCHSCLTTDGRNASPPAADRKRHRVREHSRASARAGEGEAARCLRDARHGRSRARTGSKIRMRAARLATHRGRLHQPARLRPQRQPVPARGFRRPLPRRLPRLAGRALSSSPRRSTTSTSQRCYAPRP